MKNISYIITHRSNSPYRINNLYTVVDYLSRNLPQIEIIVVEQDAKPSDIRLPPQIKHYFVKNEGLFNRAWGFNVGFTNASHDLLVFGDNDIILPLQAIKTSARWCNTCETISPYPTGSILDLSLDQTKFFLKTNVLKKEIYHTQSNTRIGPYAGGVIFMTRDAFNKVGGWEEQIKGWGGEDDHMTIKIEKIIQKKFELQSSYALHLYHRNNNLFNHPTLHTENPHYQNNLRCIEQVKNTPTAQLIEHCRALLPQIGKPLK